VDLFVGGDACHVLILFDAAICFGFELIDCYLHLKIIVWLREPSQNQNRSHQPQLLLIGLTRPIVVASIVILLKFVGRKLKDHEEKLAMHKIYLRGIL
jgi:hypothetical protein